MEADEVESLLHLWCYAVDWRDVLCTVHTSHVRESEAGCLTLNRLLYDIYNINCIIYFDGLIIAVESE